MPRPRLPLTHRLSAIDKLLSNNKEWAQHMEKTRPGFFKGLANQQTPKFLWIGCSDSRVPANQITCVARARGSISTATTTIAVIPTAPACCRLLL